MPSKLKARKPSEDISRPRDVDARSVFGDSRATSEDAMMLAHATSLRAIGLISEEMRTMLSQPWHACGQLKMKYTEAYLAMHPDYTGANVDMMPSYEVALRRQKQRDVVMEKLIKDYEKGRVDQDGKNIGRRRRSSSSILSLSTEKDDGDYDDEGQPWLNIQDEYTHNNTITGDDSSDQSMRRSEPSRKRKRISTDDKGKLAQKTDTDIYNTHEMTTRWNNCRSNSTSASPTTSATLSQPLPRPTLPKAKTKSPSKSHPLPISPIPNHPTYASHSYYELAALCRARSLPGYGNLTVMRNRVIQDDINIEMGVEREFKVRHGRKIYKTVVPEEEIREGADLADGQMVKETEKEKKVKRKRCIKELGGDDGEKKVKI
jgi:hypothetical protein